MAATRSRSLGFTLVEAMVVVGILAILATLSLPSFSSLVESLRASGAATDIEIALTRCRSEAIKQNASTKISPKSGNWASGWQILDSNNAVIDDHGTVRSLTITGPADVTYQVSGRLKGGAAPSFSITGNYANSERCVSVDLSGRPVVKKGSC